MENTRKRVKGISVCNPVIVEKNYLMYTVDYAIEKGVKKLRRLIQSSVVCLCHKETNY